ncbi:hypothetical protein AB0469_01685 [Streptomyces sp. NPDC093801]|uniref:hypothetical protein n=1 Tax=Streptomyces sp. NPDC093801 TaxID=3155203 RepID=UPI00344D73E8
MSESDTYELLMNGFSEVSRILDEKNSTLVADPILAELVRIAAQDPSSDGVKLALLQVLGSRDMSAAVEIVQYFAQSLRWNWLQIEVRQRYVESVTNGDRRKIRHYERMLEAFSADWEDRDLFPSLDS